MRDLGGCYEFYDFGLGFNNTDLALRALKAGYRIIVDDNNIASCINHWDALKGKDENGGMERGRRLNDPLFYGSRICCLWVNCRYLELRR